MNCEFQAAHYAIMFGLCVLRILDYQLAMLSDDAGKVLQGPFNQLNTSLTEQRILLVKTQLMLSPPMAIKGFSLST